jgi:hypothetical protein
MIITSPEAASGVRPGLNPQEPGKDEPKSAKHFADADKMYKSAAGECRRHALGHLVRRHDELRTACEQEQQREQDLNRPQSFLHKRFSKYTEWSAQGPGRPPLRNREAVNPGGNSNIGSLL